MKKKLIKFHRHLNWGIKTSFIIEKYMYILDISVFFPTNEKYCLIKVDGTKETFIVNCNLH